MPCRIPVVGLCYDLTDDYRNEGVDPETLTTLDNIATISTIDTAIQSLGFRTDRIGNIKALIKRLSNGDKWDLVFNMTAGIYGMAREAQVTALLEAYQIPSVFSSAATMVLLFDKSLAKLKMQAHGVTTAPFKLVRSLEDLEDVRLEYPLFAKPVAECSGKGIGGNSRVENAEQLRMVCEDLLKKFKQPVLVEQYLSGREFTVGLLGFGESTRVIGIMEVVIDSTRGEANYGFENKLSWMSHITHKLLVREPEPELWDRIRNLAVSAWKAVEGRDGGRLDVRCDDKGTPHIIEINPLAGLKPGFSDLPYLADCSGMSYTVLMQEIVANACARYGITLPKERAKI